MSAMPRLQPSHSAEPAAHNGLRSALAALQPKAGDPRDLALALASLQGDLLASQSARVVGVSATHAVLVAGEDRLTEAEAALAARAVRSGAMVAEPCDQGVRLAIGLGWAWERDEGEALPLAALHRLTKATPLALALAQERLELSTALARTLLTHSDAAGATQQAALAERLAAAALDANLERALHLAAREIAAHAKLDRLIIGALRAGRVAGVGDSAVEQPPKDLRQRLALAIGEVSDLGAEQSAALTSGGVARAFGGAAGGCRAAARPFGARLG
jgi:hypothetical protein